MINFNENIELSAWGVTLRPWLSSDASLIVGSVVDSHTWRFTTEAISKNDEVEKNFERA